MQKESAPSFWPPRARIVCIEAGLSSRPGWALNERKDAFAQAGLFYRRDVIYHVRARCIVPLPGFSSSRVFFRHGHVLSNSLADVR